MQFGKDYANLFWFSKLNFLAMEVAKYEHDVRFYDSSCSDVTVVQCDSGIITAPAGILQKRFYLVLHDWLDKYQEYADRAIRIICLGNFEHPKFIHRVDTLDSFPIDKTLHPVPKNPYDVVIGGMLGPDDDEYVLANIRDTDQNIVLCTYADENPELESTIKKIVDGLGQRKQILVRPNINDVMLRMLYRTAKRIVHCGSGTRGLLHTLGVANGCELITKTSDNNFLPSDLKDFIKLLK